MPSTHHGAAPKVVYWYRLYCVAMAMLYLACTAGGVLLFLYRDRIGGLDGESVGWLAYGVILFGVGLVLLAAFSVALLLPLKPWAWIYHLCLIALGLSSICCMMASVPLLVFWIKPETRAYFGRSLT